MNTCHECNQPINGRAVSCSSRCRSRRAKRLRRLRHTRNRTIFNHPLAALSWRGPLNLGDLTNETILTEDVLAKALDRAVELKLVERFRGIYRLLPKGLDDPYFDVREPESRPDASRFFDALLDVLKAHGATHSQVLLLLAKMPPEQYRPTLTRMVHEEGLVERLGWGMYRLADVHATSRIALLK